MEYYDVIIAGGSVAGLTTARECSSNGNSTIVIEEDHEIGTPEHCGGMVSLSGLQKLGLMLNSNNYQNAVPMARIRSKSASFEISAEKQNVIVVDRRGLDKQIAKQAEDAGAQIRTRCTFKSIAKKESKYAIKTSDGEIECKYFVDAKGLGSLKDASQNGILASAQFEVYAKWIEGKTVEILFDSDKYPGFFMWIIPMGDGRGKIGVAGRGINTSVALNEFIRSKGDKYSIIRKIFAPIWIGGPRSQFVFDRTLVVGDAAGQTKPTTAGGIFSCGMGGVLAGQAISNAIEKNDDSLLYEYEKSWKSMFQKEFQSMLLARRVLERLDNKAIDGIFSSLSKKAITDVSDFSDFDFHSSALALFLKTKITTNLTKILIGNEFRRVFGNRKDDDNSIHQ
ncbi:NAD(P)/FAD-dependent oxidoreductase [soil metagenome]